MSDGTDCSCTHLGYWEGSTLPFAPHGQRLLRHGFGIADWDAGGWTAAGSKSVGIYFKYAPSHGHPAVVN